MIIPQALHAVEGHTLVCFLPTIINQLFRLLVTVEQGDVTLNIVRVLIHVVTTVFEAGTNAPSLIGFTLF